MDTHHTDLLRAAQHLLERIDLCFLFDGAYTEGLEFKELAAALMANGLGTPGAGSNIEGLADAMEEFRIATGRALAASADPCFQVRQLQKHDRRINQCLYGQDTVPDDVLHQEGI